VSEQSNALIGNLTPDLSKTHCGALFCVSIHQALFCVSIHQALFCVSIHQAFLKLTLFRARCQFNTRQGGPQVPFESGRKV
jgi:hypothetical protein